MDDLCPLIIPILWSDRTSVLSQCTHNSPPSASVSMARFYGKVDNLGNGNGLPIAAILIQFFMQWVEMTPFRI